jgi:hypothetical protein
MKRDRINEAFKVTYPSLQKFVNVNFTDPRVYNTDRKIYYESDGTLLHDDQLIEGHYIMYEDKTMPRKYIAVFVDKKVNEDTGEISVYPIGIDNNKHKTISKIKYRQRVTNERSKAINED